MKQSPLEEKLTTIVTPVIEDMGYRLILVRMTSENKRNVLQVLAENPQTHNIGVEECAEISRAVSAALDVEDPIAGTYALEVSSPGIDRPLVSPEDYDFWTGCEAKIELSVPLSGQKRFRGILNGRNESGHIVLQTGEEDIALPFDSVQKAKLILTDELIAKTKQLMESSQQKDLDYGTGTSR